MPAVSSPSKQTADLLENLSLNSHTKTAETPEPTKKLSTSQYGSSDLATNTAKPLQQSTTPLHVDPNAYYFPNGYPSTAYYHAGYDGDGNEWDNYSIYVNPDGVEMLHGVDGNNGAVMYHQGYGLPPFGAYEPNSPVTTMGDDGQLYGAQHYQYPGPFYQPPTSNSPFYPPNPASPSQREVPSAATADQGVYGNNGAVMYHQGYGYSPFGPYPSSNSPVPTMGDDGQLYGAQHYQYPGPFYQPPTSASPLYPPNPTSPTQGEVPSPATADKVPFPDGTATENPNSILNVGSVNKNNGPKPFRPSNQNLSSNLNGSYKRGGLPVRYPSSGYHDHRFAYDGFQSPIPWFDASGTGYSAPPLNFHLSRSTSGLSQASGFMNMYPNNRIYGQYGNRAGSGFGSSGYHSWKNGHGFVVVDNKYRPRDRGNGNENIDGLNELNRGPRARHFKNTKKFGPVTQTAEGQNFPLTENNKEDNLPQFVDKEQYNREDFPEDYSDAKFFVIKSYSEDDVHKSIKYGVWASTPNGNKKLDAAYHQAKENPGVCPVFLLFSVNASGQFVGLAEMVAPVDFNRTVEYWQQDKWVGCFPVKWHIIKDVPNSSLRHITLENNENKPVTNSRDTQEVILEKGIQILKIFKSLASKTSILDDFGFYATREKIMQEKKAKQIIQKQVLNGLPVDDNGVVTGDKDKVVVIGKDGSQLSMDAALIKEPVSAAAAVEVVKKNGDAKLPEENTSDALVESSS